MRAIPLKIQSWADIPDSAFHVYQCDGCGGEDVTQWVKTGVAHYLARGVVCGHFVYVRPYNPHRSPQISRDEMMRWKARRWFRVASHAKAATAARKAGCS